MVLPSGGIRRFIGVLQSLGKGSVTRGAILLAAIVLSLAGCLAPHTDRDVLAALLFFCAAAMALIATARSLDDDAPRVTASQVSPSSAPRATAHRARPLPRTLHELASASESGFALDPSHWYRMTHRMSHELRTPLNAVLGFSELMASESFGPLGSPQYVDYARAINASGRTLLKSAEDALAITNLLTGHTSSHRPQSANLRSSFNDMMAFHQLEAGQPGLDLSGWNDSNCEILGEAQTLRQIMINLMAVALDLGGKSAAIRLDCTCDAQEVRIGLCVEGRSTAAPVRDDDFSLALARTLVQLSQARIEEYSGPNRWSVEVIFQRACQPDFFSPQ
jgi:two-component system cell cycle sensor histidine kinase PleC